MFTQRDEEPYILEVFKNIQGRFLDIGAYDGKTFSTTRALALQGWSGVLVEPSPSVLNALYELYKDFEDMTIIPKAVTKETGVIDFYDCGGDMISTVNTEHRDLWAKQGVSFNKIQIETLSVNDLFNQIGYHFDYISLDVEGTNMEIFQEIPFEKLTELKLICVEYDLQAEEMIEYIKKYDFQLLHQTAENILLLR